MEANRSNQEDVLRDVHRNRIAHEIVQQVIGECPYIGTARDDEVWWNLHELQEQNALPDGHDADNLYNLFRSNYGN